MIKLSSGYIIDIKSIAQLILDDVLGVKTAKVFLDFEEVSRRECLAVIIVPKIDFGDEDFKYDIEKINEKLPAYSRIKNIYIKNGIFDFEIARMIK